MHNSAKNDQDLLLQVLEAEFDRKERNFQPWLPQSAEDRREQKILQQILVRRAGATFGQDCVVSRGATILTQKFVLGDRSWVASGAIIRGVVRIGSRSTVNPFAHIAGKVTIGSGVRIAGLASIYGFNHGFQNVDTPIYKQKHTSIGIFVGDGTWIGANAVILDGVEIGEHSIVAAGAVVTKSFPAYQIIGGNPARILKDRLEVAADPTK